MATTAPDLGVSDAECDAFRGDGAVALRRVISGDWIAALRDGVEQALAAPSKVSKDYARDGAGGRFFTDHFMYRRFDIFRRFLFDSPAAAIAARLTGASKMNLVDEHLLVKEPGTENPTYWHQDLPYFEMNGSQFVSLWIPLDTVTAETGTMRFVRGSHRWGKLFRPIRIGLGEIVEEADAFDGPAPDIDGAPGEYDILSWDFAPGDCVAFHAAVLHAATANLSSDTRRRALAVRFAGDDVRWQPRPYIPSVPDTPALIAGGPIDCDIYPRIWTAAG